jgi:hypothetical protein
MDKIDAKCELEVAYLRTTAASIKQDQGVHCSRKLLFPLKNKFTSSSPNISSSSSVIYMFRFFEISYQNDLIGQGNESLGVQRTVKLESNSSMWQPRTVQNWDLFERPLICLPGQPRPHVIVQQDSRTEISTKFLCIFHLHLLRQLARSKC